MIKEEIQHGARIRISKKLIAGMLGYEGGIIHRMTEPEGYINPDEVHIYLEHPDLPIIKPGCPIEDVMPMIEVKYYKNGRYSFRRLKDGN